VPVFSRQFARFLALIELLAVLLFALLVFVQLFFFLVRTTNLLSYPFPLDYGEGPLQAQVTTLLGGTPIWALYRDPGVAPYLVVNYPPVYHLITTPLALLFSLFVADTPGAVLLAGRSVSLIAGILSVLAIWRLCANAGRMQPATSNQPPATSNQPPVIGYRLSAIGYRLSAIGYRLSAIGYLLLCLALLGIPIMREWSSLMRVDLLGICFGLWALVLVQRATTRRALCWVALLLVLTLLTKPSLLAAPAAAFCWLFFRNWRNALLLGMLCLLLGAGSIAALQLASGNWFWLHVIQANANPWDADLAYGFWRDQIVILLPLMLAGVVAIIGTWQQRGAPDHKTQPAWLLPLYYTLFGLLTALGVGKLGAYTNYFLEAYAGLFWLAASGIVTAYAAQPRQVSSTQAPIALQLRSHLFAILIFIGVATSLLRYYPLWSEEYLLPAGIIEGRNPIRLSFGGNGIWQDLQRERTILAARGMINQALLAPIRSLQAPIFTDIPGVAAQAGVASRIQSFEHRMLIDPQLWDERALLRDLANGTVPLVVLDYLGNWMTNEQIAIITNRYAQDVSVGLYSIYQPVAPGRRAAIDQRFAAGLQLVGYHQIAPLAASSYTPGEAAIFTLEWQFSRPDQQWNQPVPEVVLQLSRDGQVLLETQKPLLYGALAPDRWDGQIVQHMQALTLPAELPAGQYQVGLSLEYADSVATPAVWIANIEVVEGGGRILGEQGYFVPASLLAEWQRLGGYSGSGDPVSPAVPLANGMLQCYANACLRLQNGLIIRLPVGELTWMGEAGLPTIMGAPPAGTLSTAFQEYYDQQGGEAYFGPPIGHEMKRFDKIVQYTRYARLERPLDGSPGVTLGRVGEDVLRLPAGTAYRWP
jgi:hypothetical protein